MKVAGIFRIFQKYRIKRQWHQHQNVFDRMWVGEIKRVSNILKNKPENEKRIRNLSCGEIISYGKKEVNVWSVAFCNVFLFKTGSKEYTRHRSVM